MAGVQLVKKNNRQPNRNSAPTVVGNRNSAPTVVGMKTNWLPGMKASYQLTLAMLLPSRGEHG